MVVTICQIVVLTALLINRLLTLSIPVFEQSIKSHPFKNTAVGLFSDLFAAAVLIFFFGLARLTPPKSWQSRLIHALVIICTLGLVGGLGTHLRYMEYFGTTARIFHVQQMNGGEMWYVGLFLVLESWRTWFIFISAVVLALVSWMILRSPSRQHRLQHLLPAKIRSRKWRAGILLTLMPLFNTANINLRMKPGVHAELRYTPIQALFITGNAFAKFTSLPLPNEAQLTKTREIVGIAAPERNWEPKSDAPLWQSTIATKEVADYRHKMRHDLQTFIANGAREKGPWNILVVLQESLRAHELEAFGNSNAPYKNLTPNMSRIFRQGIRFQNTLNTGIGTRHGQVAAMCSLPAFEDFPVMTVASATRAVCLPQVFRNLGYHTVFGYGSSNQFDSQYEFYSSHGVETIFGSEVFDDKTPRGRWGVSDMALFDKTLATLRSDAGRPFFATILTLSNHGPQKLPDDAPLTIDRNLKEREQLLAYVDWAFGNLYKKIESEFPHTIIITIADHGLWWDDVISEAENHWQQTKRVNRIPFVINIPGLPAELAGEIANPVSNADLPPTLLSLLQHTAVPNGFFGVDAFSRTSPLLLNVYEKTYTVVTDDAVSNDLQPPREMPRDHAEIVGALPRYNLLAPKEFQ